MSCATELPFPPSVAAHLALFRYSIVGTRYEPRTQNFFLLVNRHDEGPHLVRLPGPGSRDLLATLRLPNDHKIYDEICLADEGRQVFLYWRGAHKHGVIHVLAAPSDELTPSLTSAHSSRHEMVLIQELVVGDRYPQGVIYAPAPGKLVLVTQADERVRWNDPGWKLITTALTYETVSSDASLVAKPSLKVVGSVPWIAPLEGDGDRDRPRSFSWRGAASGGATKDDTKSIGLALLTNRRAYGRNAVPGAVDGPQLCHVPFPAPIAAWLATNGATTLTNTTSEEEHVRPTRVTGVPSGVMNSTHTGKLLPPRFWHDLGGGANNGICAYAGVDRALEVEQEGYYSDEYPGQEGHVYTHTNIYLYTLADTGSNTSYRARDRDPLCRHVSRTEGGHLEPKCWLHPNLLMAHESGAWRLLLIPPPSVPSVAGYGHGVWRVTPADRWSRALHVWLPRAFREVVRGVLGLHMLGMSALGATPTAVASDSSRSPPPAAASEGVSSILPSSISPGVTWGLLPAELLELVGAEMWFVWQEDFWSTADTGRGSK